MGSTGMLFLHLNPMLFGIFYSWYSGYTMAHALFKSLTVPSCPRKYATGIMKNKMHNFGEA